MNITQHPELLQRLAASELLPAIRQLLEEVSPCLS